MSRPPQEPTKEVLDWIKNNLRIVPEEGIVYNREGEAVGSDATSEGFFKVYCGTFEGKCIYLKRANIIWFKAKGEWPRLQLDHLDRNNKNDRLGNLEPKTVRGNSYNRSHVIGRDLPPGIYIHQKNWYLAKIHYLGKQIFLGTYRSLDEAIRVRLSAEAMINEGVVFVNVEEFRERVKQNPCLE